MRSPLTLMLLAAVAVAACDRSSKPQRTPSIAEEPSPHFRNVDSATAYVGDAACAKCHAGEAAAYAPHYMAQSFHRWTPDTRVETPLPTPLVNRPTGFSYTVVEEKGKLYQVETLVGPNGKTLNALRRPMDYVVGSNHVARTYFTEENGRLFQLPLTWYRTHGWDFSPGYEVNDARFDRWIPDRCVACHSSYPTPLPHMEGKYAELRPGIGCERCHGPGALHVMERTAKLPVDSARDHFDRTIVNPTRLPLERRLDVCEQCHVHTAVNVLREGKDAFSYVPSQPLRDQWAFFKVAGGIDVVSHADRLRQSACFIASRRTSRPLECATCHDPHGAPPSAATRSQPCLGCHTPNRLRQMLARSSSLADHAPNADCVRCHMPTVQERTVPHGTFTDHWIRVVAKESTRPIVRREREGGPPIEPFYDRDRTGPEAPIYQAMGGIVYATLANDGRALGDAAGALDRALGTSPGRPQARFLLGVAYQQLGATEEAIRALEQSVRADSSNPETLRALAQAYDRAGRDPAAIERLYRRALALQPALAWIRAEYAGFLEAHGLVDQALGEYHAALDEQPSLAVAWFDLGTTLAGQRRLAESSKAFAEAVHLDPQLGQAMSSLVEVRTSGTSVTEVSSLGSPLSSLPVRDRGPRAARLTVTAAPASGAVFENVPPNATVQVLRPDGTVVRTLSVGPRSVVSWDLRLDSGAPLGGGLYRVRVLARDPAGQPMPPQQFYIGVVRQRSA